MQIFFIYFVNHMANMGGHVTDGTNIIYTYICYLKLLLVVIAKQQFAITLLKLQHMA